MDCEMTTFVLSRLDKLRAEIERGEVSGTAGIIVLKSGEVRTLCVGVMRDERAVDLLKSLARGPGH